MNLTKDFKLEEFDSNKHHREGIPVEAVPLSLMPNVRELARNLQILRHYIGKPIIINSGYRSPEYNKIVGGKTHSFHMQAMAADIIVKGMTPLELRDIVLELIKEGSLSEGGVGLYDTFVHYDIRKTPARWDERTNK